MKRLPKIPSPPLHYWNFFRQHILPVIVFLLALYAAVLLWKEHIGPANIIGEVEMMRANVTTTINGTVTDLNVDLLQRVQKGQPICTVIAYDPDTTKASLAAIAADLETLRSRILIDQRRNNTAYEQLRVELLLRRVELANEKVNLDYAKSEFDRTYKLFKEGSDTEFQVNYWRSQRDMFQAKVNELEKLVADLEQTVDRLKPMLTSTEMENSVNKVISDAITAKQLEIEALQKPVVLKAPMDGFVSAIFHRTGEKVPAGSPIVTISATNATRILAYVRQPLNIKPAIGDSVEIRTRTRDRTVGIGTVIDVGAQLEPITASLLPYITGSIVIGRGPDGQNITEYGLPFIVTLPDNMKLLPGEVVVMNVIKRRQ
ncbi:MAG: HlyD family secretion protein [Verrucomicrobiia bacterium]|jgi:multidrug resistance efflux pump